VMQAVQQVATPPKDASPVGLALRRHPPGPEFDSQWERISDWG
jgi:hypothetical protein